MPDRPRLADAVRRYRPAGEPVGYAVRTEHVRIAMDDGVRLAAMLYRPDGPGPYPALLESIPYRKDDWTLTRDWPLHGAFAAAGEMLHVRGLSKPADASTHPPAPAVTTSSSVPTTGACMSSRSHRRRHNLRARPGTGRPSCVAD